MANVTVNFNNKEYLLSCDDGQEKGLVELTKHLDSKYQNLKKNLGNIGENKLLLITAIKMVDDYFDLLKKVESTKKDFQELSAKFKELKSLAINYKEEKEIEIEKLTDEVNEFKAKVEKRHASNPNLIFSVQTHPRTKYQDYLKVLDQLKEAKATKISIANPPAF